MDLRILKLAECEVDLHSQVVRRVDDSVLPLTHKEAQLLGYLAEREGQIVSRDVLLREVWGYGAGTVSRAVDNMIKKLRSKVEADRRHPVHILTAHGEGYVFRLLEVHQGTPEEAGETGETDEVASEGSLPGGPQPCFGRSSERDHLEQQVEAGRLVLLLGAPGIGKTTLARAFARESRGRFDGGVWYCDLSTCRTDAELLRQVGAVLRLAEGRPLSWARVQRALNALGPCLWVLDNLEQLTDVVAHRLPTLLEGAPEVAFLGTSRHRTGVRGELCVELGPLSMDAARLVFVTFARQGRLDFQVSDQERQPLDALLQAVSCVPLAVRLAAARTRLLSIRQIAERVREQLVVLADPSRSTGHRSLSAALDTSWELLTETEREALIQCSVFRGGFAVEAAEHVLDPPQGALDTLHTLVDKSLVFCTHDDEPPHMHLYPIIQEYAAARSTPAAIAAAQARHCEYYLQRSERTRWSHAGTVGLRTDWDNLQAAFERAMPDAPDDAARAAIQLDRLCNPLVDPTERVARLDQVLGLDLSPARRRHVRYRRAKARQFADPRGTLDALEEMLGDAETVWSKIETRRALANTMMRCGEDLSRVRALLEEALHHAASEERARAAVLLDLGNLHLRTGQPRKADEALGEAEQIAQHIDAQGLLGWALLGRSRAVEMMGGSPEPLLERARQVFRTAEHHLGEIMTLLRVACTLADRGDYAQVEKLLARRSALMQRQGLRPDGLGDEVLGFIALDEGEPHEARRFLERGGRTNEALGYLEGKILSEADLGLVDLLEGQPARALERFDAALAHFEVATNPARCLSMSARRAVGLVRLGRPEEAEQALEQARTLRSTDAIHVTDDLIEVAGAAVALAKGDLELLEVLQKRSRRGELDIDVRVLLSVLAAPPQG